VSAQAIDGSLAEALGLDRPEGVLISDLHPESPFRAAGLRPGDRVTALDGTPVNAPEEMLAYLSAKGIGGTAQVAWMRDGRAMSAAVALAPAPDRPDRDARTTAGRSALPGLSLARINPAVAEELRLPAGLTQGVAVTDAEGLAAEAGLRPGDVITAINGAAVTDPRGVERALTARAATWTIDLIRGGQPVRLRFRL
jgi:S1-C subfamily serine protease